MTAQLKNNLWKNITKKCPKRGWYWLSWDELLSTEILEPVTIIKIVKDNRVTCCEFGDCRPWDEWISTWIYGGNMLRKGKLFGPLEPPKRPVRSPKR